MKATGKKKRGRQPLIMTACGLAVSLLLASAPAWAGEPSPAKAPETAQQEAGRPAGPAPVTAFAATARYSSGTLSPDGRLLALLAPLNGKRNIVLFDLQTRQARALTGMNSFDVTAFHWVGSERLVYTLGRLDTPTGPESGDGGGLFAVKVDGSAARKLVPTVREQVNQGLRRFTHMDFMAVAPGSENEILVQANLRSHKTYDIYRVNLDSGQRQLLTFDRPGDVLNWVLDRDGVPRAVTLVDNPDLPPAEQSRRVLLRENLEAPWQELARFAPGNDPAAWMPLAFAENSKDLVVSAYRGQNTRGLHRFEVETRKLAAVLAVHPRYDLGGGLLFDARSRGLIGLRFADERQQVAYFDEQHARQQANLEASFPGKTVAIQRTNSSRTLVSVYSDRAVPTYFILDEERKTLEELMPSRVDLVEQDLVEMRPFLLKTRDGLEIPSYYFLPADHQPGQRLPTVLHIHGGPHVRADPWGHLSSYGVKEAQLLASRGYAVVLPNFRITPGLGKKVYDAGFGEIGRKMSEDYEDAAAWAVQAGFADPQRICISGASYGGYASLWALIKTPDLFKCGVAGLVVSDLEVILTSGQGDIPQNKGGVAFWRQLIGQKEPGWARAHEVSPARHAERIKAPLFIYAGSDDWRTPMEQTHLMVDAMKKAGRPPEVLMIKAGEGHGYGKSENRVDLYEQMLKFLDRHIGPASLQQRQP